VIRKIDISHKTVFFIAGFLAFIWTLFLIKDLILLLFVSIIFVSAIAPLIDDLKRFKIPKPVAIALVYILVLLVLAGIITLGLTPITVQTSNLLDRLTSTVDSLARGYHLDQNSLKQQIPDLSKNIVSFTLDIFNVFITAVLVVVITFYLLLDKENLETRFSALFGENQAKVAALLKKIETKLGAWLRGQLLLSVIVAVLIYIGLFLLGIEYALPLAILSGLLEVIPIVGPIISAIPAILIALLTSPVVAGMVAMLYLLVQQMESHVIVPQVMKRAVGLNPLLVIIAIAVGSRLLGVAGALLAVPITVVIQIVGEEYLNNAA